MSARQAERPARAGSVRHSACFCPSASIGRRQPVLDVFGAHDADGAERARRNQFAGVAHHGVAGVVQRDGEDETGLFRKRREFFGLLEASRQRLVADDVDAGIEERAGNGNMEVIGRDDDDRLDAVGTLGLGFGHLKIVGIGALL